VRFCPREKGKKKDQGLTYTGGEPVFVLHWGAPIEGEKPEGDALRPRKNEQKEGGGDLLFGKKKGRKKFKTSAKRACSVKKGGPVVAGARKRGKLHRPNPKGQS